MCRLTSFFKLGQKRNQSAIILCTSSMTLLVAGIMTQLATPVVGYRAFSFHPRVFKYLSMCIIVLFVCGVGLVYSYRRPAGKSFWLKMCFPLLLFLLVFNLLVLLLPAQGGPQRWLRVSGFGFQPSEVAHIGLPMVMIYVFKQKEFHYFIRVAAGVLIVLVIPMIWLQRDYSALLLTIGCIGICLPKIIKKKFSVLIALSMVIFLAFYAAMDKTVQTRIEEFLRRDQTQSIGLTQGQLGMQAIKCGGVFGQGMKGNAVGYSIIPLAANDFAFAQFAHVYGGLPAALIIMSLWLLVDELIVLSGCHPTP